MEQDDHVDEEMLADVLMLMEDEASDGILRACDLFRDSVPERLDDIGAALAEGRFVDAGRSSHSLRGSAGARWWRVGHRPVDVGRPAGLRRRDRLLGHRGPTPRPAVLGADGAGSPPRAGGGPPGGGGRGCGLGLSRLPELLEPGIEDVAEDQELGPHLPEDVGGATGVGLPAQLLQAQSQRAQPAGGRRSVAGAGGAAGSPRRPASPAVRPGPAGSCARSPATGPAPGTGPAPAATRPSPATNREAARPR